MHRRLAENSRAFPNVQTINQPTIMEDVVRFVAGGGTGSETARYNQHSGERNMKLVTAALCLLSIGVLSGCVDDRGYRGTGYATTGVYYRTYERDRYYRHYDRRDWRDRRGDWRDGDRGRYRGDNRVIYGVIQR
jgi:hypothetical protein